MSQDEIANYYRLPPWDPASPRYRREVEDTRDDTRDNEDDSWAPDEAQEGGGGGA